MRRAAKVDANHSSIAAAFAKLGCSVRSLAAVGGGMPDLLVGISGRNLLIEIKDGAKAASRRKLTPDQVKFHADWRGQVWTVECLDDVETIVRALRGK